MDVVAITVAVVLTALLVVRELVWRRAFDVVRERLAISGIQIREQEQLAHVGQLVSGPAPRDGVGHARHPARRAGRPARHRARPSHCGRSRRPCWSGDLSACRQIIQAHGGSLEVERPANGGYRFHRELPVTAAGAGTARAT